MKSLDDLKIGDVAKVIFVEGTCRRRLYEMGFTQGTNVKYILPSPFVYPKLFSVRGYNISLDKPNCIAIKVA
jgi:Fe2+ transport system protein FeoA